MAGSGHRAEAGVPSSDTGPAKHDTSLFKFYPPPKSRSTKRSLRCGRFSKMRAVLQVFENYQKARVNFVQTVAELATRPQNIEALQNAGVMQLLRPLLLDNVPSIQQSAALALGRLANYNDEIAKRMSTLRLQLKNLQPMRR